jgi:hypothetical protein
MHKEDWQCVSIIGFVAAIAGGVMLFNSSNFGMAAAEKWLTKQGSAGTDMYHIMMESYIDSFLAAGCIFLSFGMVLIFVSYYMIRILIGKEPDSGESEQILKE